MAHRALAGFLPATYRTSHRLRDSASSIRSSKSRKLFGTGSFATLAYLDLSPFAQAILRSSALLSRRVTGGFDFDLIMASKCPQSLWLSTAS